VIFCGCNRTGDKPGKERNAAKPQQPDEKYYSEAKLGIILTLGMSEENILKSLGSPSVRTDERDGLTRLDYFLPFDERIAPPRRVVSGVTVYITNGVLSRWAPMYMVFSGHEGVTH
jgi:hypothetical protein